MCKSLSSGKFARNNPNGKRNENRIFELFLIAVLACVKNSSNYSDMTKSRLQYSVIMREEQTVTMGVDAV